MSPFSLHIEGLEGENRSAAVAREFSCRYSGLSNRFTFRMMNLHDDEGETGMMQKWAALLALVFGLATTGWASNETVLWNFTKSNGDGAYPWSNVLISDSNGNLYGVTGGGGTNSAGMVFELSPDGHGDYSQTVIYDFKGFGSGDG